VASTALPRPEATMATRPPTLVSERMISRLSTRVSTMMDSSSTTARLAVSRVRNGLRHEVAAAGEGGADRKALGADVPFRAGAVELHEAALFQRGQKAM